MTFFETFYITSFCKQIDHDRHTCISLWRSWERYILNPMKIICIFIAIFMINFNAQAGFKWYIMVGENIARWNFLKFHFSSFFTKMFSTTLSFSWSLLSKIFNIRFNLVFWFFIKLSLFEFKKNQKYIKFYSKFQII